MNCNLSRHDLHRYIYISGIILLVISLPLSRFLLSISQFILALNWLAEGHFRTKFSTLSKKYSVWLIVSIFILYCAGFLFSSNQHIALMKIKNVLPFLMLPLVIGTSVPLSPKQFKLILLIFAGAVFTAAIAGTFHYYMHFGEMNGDHRKISVFIGHACFALQVNMAVFILLYHSGFSENNFRKKEKAVFLTVAGMLIVFLFFLRSLTGIIAFTITGIFWVFHLINQNRFVIIRNVIIILLSATIISVSTSGLLYIKRNFYAPPVNTLRLDSITPNGNHYTHRTENKVLENGNYVGLYVCEPELQEGWNSVSHIPYDSLDMLGQPVNQTIIRYLTSKGLRKDLAGIKSLSMDDIQAIEKGNTNYRFAGKNRLMKRIYETIWEIHVYKKTGFVQYHSFAQRLVFLQFSGKIIQQTWWKGLGTGDVYDTLLHTVQKDNVAVDPLWEGKPHNQYAFLLLAFGVPGFLWIVFSMVYPAIQMKAYKHVMFNAYVLMLVVSLMSFDFFETYDGIVFIAFFYNIFVFGIRRTFPD